VGKECGSARLSHNGHEFDSDKETRDVLEGGMSQWHQISSNPDDKESSGDAMQHSLL
jgi:hypothetical protein